MRCFLLLLTLLTSLSLSAAEPRVFFGNLHSHTSYSDGSGTPRQAYKYARDTAHLDFLAITEHNHRLAEQGAGARADGRLIATTPARYNGPAAPLRIGWGEGSRVRCRATRFSNRQSAIRNRKSQRGQEFSTISSGNHVNVFDIGEVIDDQAVTNGHFELLLPWLAAHHDTTGADPIVQFNHPDSGKRAAGIEYGRDDFPDPTAFRAVTPLRIRWGEGRGKVSGRAVFKSEIRNRKS